MTLHDATEAAYRNGYEKGAADALKNAGCIENMADVLMPIIREFVDRFFAEKHGRWIEAERYRDEDGYIVQQYICSVCGRYEDEKEPYCNCGAKMDLPEPYSPDIPREQWEDKARFE